MIWWALKMWNASVITYSKPLANRLQKAAASHPKFGRCIATIGRTTIRIVAPLQRAAGREATPPTEQECFHTTAAIILELCAFTAAGAALRWRSSRKEAREELRRQEDIEFMERIAASRHS